MTGRIDFRHHLERAWRLTIENIIALVILAFVTLGVSIVSMGILAPVMTAGFFHATSQLVTDAREPRAQDAFGQMRLFLPLFALGFVLALIVFIGMHLLVLPGFIVSIAAGYFGLYIIPLMTEEGLGLMDAIRESIRMAMAGEIVDNIIVFIVYAGILALGGSFFIGLLFALPLATVFLASIHEEKRRV